MNGGPEPPEPRADERSDGVEPADRPEDAEPAYATIASAEAETTQTAGAAEERTSPAPAEERSGRRLVLVAVAASILLATVATGWLWWRHEPETPLEELGLESLEAAPDAVDGEASEPVDAEQLAFLERQRRRAGELAETTEKITDDLASSLESQGGVTLTDRSLVRSLAGRWRLDLGTRQVVAEFAPVVVERVRRGSLLVELYPVDSRALPPFYTVFELPEKGAFIAFRAADGSYRLVLEKVTFHGPDLFSFELDRGGRRRTAYRLKGSVPPALGRREPPPGAAPDEAVELDREPSEAPVRIVVEPPPPAEEMWREAERLRDEGRLQSLESHLRRLLGAYPRHRQARRWSGRIDGWIREQRHDLVDDLQDELEDLAEAVDEHDLDEIFESWDERPDAATRRFFTELLARHRHLEARFTLQSVVVEDGTLAFSVVATLEGWSGRSRDREIIPLRWRGHFRDGHFVTPFE